MLTYRTFRNADPPLLTELWRSREGQPGLAQPVSSDVLDQLVFARLYFDYDGLFLALDDGRPVGFAHAGFGPNGDASWISTDVGMTCMLLVRPGCEEAEVATGLLERCEEYLRRRGAKVLYGGAFLPLAPFYLGLYGGSQSLGVLDSDLVAQQAYAARGYQSVGNTLRLRRDLSGFESTIDRQQMQIRRQMVVEATMDAPTHTWWEASTLGEFDLTRFDLLSRVGGPAIASALFRSMEPSGAATGGRAAGLIDLQVDPAYRRRGLATFLLSEAFRQFIRQGIMLVEAHIAQDTAAALAALRKLDFLPVEEGCVFKKVE